MNIRLLHNEDYPAVDRLMQQVHQLHLDARPDLFIPLEHPLPPEQYQEMVGSNRAICLAAEQDGQIAGICFVTIRNKSCMVEDTIAYLDDLCVDERFRHCGIGKALMERAQQLAKEKGASRLDLMVWEFNRAALQFYRSLGMEPQRYIFEKKL